MLFDNSDDELGILVTAMEEGSTSHCCATQRCRCIKCNHLSRDQTYELMEFIHSHHRIKDRGTHSQFQLNLSSL
jgi:hypothetical protein